VLKPLRRRWLEKSQAEGARVASQEPEWTALRTS